MSFGAENPAPYAAELSPRDAAPGSLHPKTGGFLPKNEGAEIKTCTAMLKGSSCPKMSAAGGGSGRRGQLISGGDTWKRRPISDSAGGRGGSDTAQRGGRGERGAGLGTGPAAPAGRLPLPRKTLLVWRDHRGCLGPFLRLGSLRHRSAHLPLRHNARCALCFLI